MKKISKELSPNDAGETGSHQAGILIPKDERIQSFFPELTKEEKNPRVKLSFKDESGKDWMFNFIYYNNKYYGGTRDEFRLTGMTEFLREHNAKSGDEIVFEKSSSDKRFIKHKRKDESQDEDQDVLKLGSSWKILNT